MKLAASIGIDAFALNIGKLLFQFGVPFLIATMQARTRTTTRSSASRTLQRRPRASTCSSPSTSRTGMPAMSRRSASTSRSTTRPPASSSTTARASSRRSLGEFDTCISFCRRSLHSLPVTASRGAMPSLLLASPSSPALTGSLARSKTLRPTAVSRGARYALGSLRSRATRSRPFSVAQHQQPAAQREHDHRP